jgi:hypothetical protein
VVAASGSSSEYGKDLGRPIHLDQGQIFTMFYRHFMNMIGFLNGILYGFLFT